MTLSVPFPHFVNQLAWWHNSCYKSQESCLTRTFPRKVHAEETTKFAIIALVLWAIVLLELQLGEKNILEILQLMHEQACFEKQAMVWSDAFTFWCFLAFMMIRYEAQRGQHHTDPVTLRGSWWCCLCSVLSLPTKMMFSTEIELSSSCPFF